MFPLRFFRNSNTRCCWNSTHRFASIVCIEYWYNYYSDFISACSINYNFEKWPIIGPCPKLVPKRYLWPGAAPGLIRQWSLGGSRCLWTMRCPSCPLSKLNVAPRLSVTIIDQSREALFQTFSALPVFLDWLLHFHIHLYLSFSFRVRGVANHSWWRRNHGDLARLSQPLWYPCLLPVDSVGPKRKKDRSTVRV